MIIRGELVLFFFFLLLALFFALGFLESWQGEAEQSVMCVLTMRGW